MLTNVDLEIFQNRVGPMWHSHCHPTLPHSNLRIHHQHIVSHYHSRRLQTLQQEEATHSSTFFPSSALLYSLLLSLQPAWTSPQMSTCLLPEWGPRRWVRGEPWFLPGVTGKGPRRQAGPPREGKRSLGKRSQRQTTWRQNRRWRWSWNQLWWT